MIPLSLPLAKPGDTTATVKKIMLSLSKTARFTVELAWDSTHDLDGHAFLTANSGAGAKVTYGDPEKAMLRILSTYNSPKTNPQGVLTLNPDESFQTPCGGLHHSGDSRTGVVKKIDEAITIDGSKIESTVNEIPVFITIHDPRGEGHTFAGVRDASITIRDDSGTVLGSYALTSEFAKFNGVQMGSIIRGPQGFEYAPIGKGFTGTFNNVLEAFC